MRHHRVVVPRRFPPGWWGLLTYTVLWALVAALALEWGAGLSRQHPAVWGVRAAGWLCLALFAGPVVVPRTGGGGIRMVAGGLAGAGGLVGMGLLGAGTSVGQVSAWGVGVGVLWVPAAEELLFRGALFERARRRWGAGWAVVATSLAFVAFHVEGGAFLPALAAGLVLGGLRAWTGGPWAAFLAHALYNLAIFRGF